MIKPTKLAALLAVTAIAVGACGPSGSTGAPATGAPATGGGATAAPPTAAAYPAGPVNITLWTKEGEADGSLQFVQKLAADYTAAHPNVTITVVNKDVEALREDFLTASLAGQAPELLWTVADHVGPFTASGTVLPLDGIVDTASVPAQRARRGPGRRQDLGRADLVRQPPDAVHQQGPRAGDVLPRTATR